MHYHIYQKNRCQAIQRLVLIVIGSIAALLGTIGGFGLGALVIYWWLAHAG